MRPSIGSGFGTGIARLLLFFTLLLPLTSISCGEEPPAKPTRGPKFKRGDKTVSKAGGEKGAEAQKPAEASTQAALAGAPPLEQKPLREGAPSIFAQYKAGHIVPIAVLGPNGWIVEEAMGIEGLSFKETTPPEVEKWWARLGIQTGDEFYLRGDFGAEGVLTIDLKFKTLDRGGCQGQVWAIPGKAKWNVAPKFAKEDGERGEQVWAIRSIFIPRGVKLGRELTEAEKKGGAAALVKLRETLHQNMPKVPEETTWSECDSLSESMCKNADAQAISVDLEGLKTAEVLATIQMRPVYKNEAEAPPTRKRPIVEARVILELTDTSANVIGRWDGNIKAVGESARPAQFGGLIDITGDGRSEVILSKSANEVTNWTIYTVDAEKPGSWRELFHTEINGC